MNTTAVQNVDDLERLLEERLGAPAYADEYESEVEFESDVWKRVVTLAKDLRIDPAQSCLTSHAIHADRSCEAWQGFCAEEVGPDVNILGSKNRLDIVLRHPQLGSIGIEVKCLGAAAHSSKLTQGLGQAVLGLANRVRTMLVIHCGAVNKEERDRLRDVATRICAGSRVRIVVVPQP